MDDNTNNQAGGGCSPEEKIRFLRGLRAVRQFSADPLPNEVVNAVLEVARWSGSSRNAQPWEFVLVRDRATLQALAGAGGNVQHLAGAALGIVLVIKGPSPDEETYDEGRLTERILLAASAYGVGAAVGWFQGDGAETTKRALGIPDDKRVRSVISLGYPAPQQQRSPRSAPGRKPLSELVHEEHY